MAEKTVSSETRKPSDVETCEPSSCTARVKRRPCPESIGSAHHGPTLISYNSSKPRNKRRRRNDQQQKRCIPAPPKLRCVVCSTTDSSRPRYKCPKCRALYCSMSCCKEHKKVCSGNPAAASAASVGTEMDSRFAGSLSSPGLLSLPSWKMSQACSQADSDNDDDSIDDGWKLNEDMKKAVEQSNWLHQELSDGGLRDLIAYVVSQPLNSPRRLDSGQNKEALQSARRRFPHFQVFVDKLLVVAGILHREHHSKPNGVNCDGEISFEEEPLEEWLKRDWSGDAVPPQLTLNPVLRKVPIFQAVDVSTSSSASSDEDDGDSKESSNETSSFLSGESLSYKDISDNEIH